MNKNNKYGLVADIGGTNARFALVELDSSEAVELLAQKTLPTADYQSLTDAASDYLQTAGYDQHTVLSGSFAVAGAINGDWFQMTNNPWAFSVQAVRQELGFESLHLLNDFGAIAWSIPTLKENEFIKIGGGESVPGVPVAVLGPGTGLGVGAYILQDDQFIALQTEGGHASFAPQNDLEVEIMVFLQKKYGRVSWERVLSGPGLENIYSALVHIKNIKDEQLNASQITQVALRENDALCIEVLNQFCASLGSLAGDVALTMGARGGVNIAGGIVPRFVDFFVASPFRERFEKKGRFSAYNAAIVTQLVVAEQPGLLGAAAHQRTLWRQSRK
ncbi:MAG: glucokinase [Gammaproteobacteria bacterium]|nr:glucokinase [Gammaproteobacteria bacterium]